MSETITYEDFSKIKLQVATIKEVEAIEKSDKLLKIIVSLGEEKRQVIAGIGKKYNPEDLIEKQIVMITNLEERSLMGLISEGMILAADGEDGPVIINPNEKVKDGSLIK